MREKRKYSATTMKRISFVREREGGERERGKVLETGREREEEREEARGRERDR